MSPRPSQSSKSPGAVCSLLPPSAAEDLRTWHGEISQGSHAGSEASRCFAAELAVATAALRSAMADSAIRRGLAVASPDFLKSVLQGKESTARADSRFARTCMSYLVRSAAKTSPFSTFTRLGMAFFDQPVSAGADGEPDSAVHLSRSLTTAWLFATARHPELARAWVYEPNPSLLQEARRPYVYMLVPDYIARDTLFYRQERLVNASAYAHLIRLVQAVGRATYDDYITQIGGNDPHATFLRLLGTFLILPVAPWSRLDADPLRAMAARLGTLPAPEACAASADMQSVTNVAGAIAARSGAERLGDLSEMKQTITRSFARIGQPTPDLNGLVYENARIQHDIPALGPAVRADLTELGRLMRPQIIVTHLYDHLVDHFVQRYGPGESTADILGFLYSFANRPDFQQLLTGALQADTEAMNSPGPPRSRRPVGPGTLPPTSTVFFQVVARSAQAIAGGDYLLVVNQLNPGTGGLLSRFNPLLSGPSGMGTHMDRWLREMRPSTDLLDFPLLTEWSSLQHGGLGDRPMVEWPLELPTVERQSTYPLRELKLAHSEQHGTLSLIRADGRPVSLAYLGATPTYLIGGVVRLLLTLVDPWINGYRVGWMPRLNAPPPVPPNGVEFFPRETYGRLVIRRARWRIPVSEYPVQGPGEDDFAFFRRAHTWSTEHHLPAEIYVSQERKALSLDARHRKPMWLRFDSFHALAATKALVEQDTVSLSMTEALPGRHDHWVIGGDGRPRCSEFVALLRWNTDGA